MAHPAVRFPEHQVLPRGLAVNSAQRGRCAMTHSDAEVNSHLPLGEDGYWEFKRVVFRGNQPTEPRRDRWVDEITAFANASGGVLLCGVIDTGDVPRTDGCPGDVNRGNVPGFHAPFRPDGHRFTGPFPMADQSWVSKYPRTMSCMEVAAMSSFGLPGPEQLSVSEPAPGKNNPPCSGPRGCRVQPVVVLVYGPEPYWFDR